MLEGREILQKNIILQTLIGKNLSKEIVNQPVDDTHDGILYYLLTDPIGQQLLKDYPDLKAKINPASLEQAIKTGPQKGETLQNLYNKLFPTEASHSPALQP
jgi:hypothetical protein